MKIENFLLYLIFVFTTFSCRKDPKIEAPYKYAFFVAGHTYGFPQIPPKKGLHTAFENHIPFLNQYDKMNFGIFTGDVVNQSTQEFWNSAQSQINQFNMPIHISPGNHDRGPIFESMYKPYYHYKLHNDLFVILNSNNWEIINNQKEYLTNLIKNNSKSVNHIFIFTHELIWWSPTNIFNKIKINYLPNYPGSSNYWDDIFPIFDTLQNNITFFAGDLGATKQVTPYMYYKDKNITYIASGMGSNVNDNIVVVEMDYNGNPHYKLFGLNTTKPTIIEDLEKFILP